MGYTNWLKNPKQPNNANSVAFIGPVNAGSEDPPFWIDAAGRLKEYQNITLELSTNKTLRDTETDCYQDNCSKQSLWKLKSTAELTTNAENVTIATFKVKNHVSYIFGIF